MRERPALFAGANDDGVPMRLFLDGLLLIEPHHAARGQHRRNRSCPEFSRFLQGPVHAFAAGDALHKGDSHRRFASARRRIAQLYRHLVAVDRDDFRRMVNAAAVEHDERRAGTHAQHARDVVRACGRQRHRGTDRQWTFAKYPVEPHGPPRLVGAAIRFEL